MSEREHDLVLYGASGFVGRLVAEHLAAAVPDGVRVALAGRHRDRVEVVRDGLGGRAAGWSVLVADSADGPALARLAGSTRVVATTVGPYARHGLPLVAACAAAGTHYADLAGEVLFMRDSIDRHAQAATASGARIVHGCGFDSVPSDLGVLLAAERARDDGAGELTEATLVVVSARGGMSGGTVDSLRVQVDAARADPSLRDQLADPYLLSPDRAAEPDLGPQPDTFLAERLDDGSWAAPFVMAPINTRVVRRSNALLGHAYGRELRYREVIGTGRSVLAPAAAVGIAAGVGAVAAGLALGPVRPLLDRVLPAPGSGPSERARRSGHFRVEVRARTAGGARYVTTVAASGDPGYAATAVMFGESALALAVDEPATPLRAGVLTPATALGDALVRRLRAQGFTLEVRQSSSA